MRKKLENVCCVYSLADLLLTFLDLRGEIADLLLAVLKTSDK